MGDKEIVYKVGTYVEEGMFASAFVKADKWQLFYRVDETTIPKDGTCIFAFDTLEDAAIWANARCTIHCVVWESEAIVVDNRPLWMSNHTGSIGLRDFWTGGTFNRTPTPHGTIWCSELTPIEEVKGPWNILH